MMTLSNDPVDPMAGMQALVADATLGRPSRRLFLQPPCPKSKQN